MRLVDYQRTVMRVCFDETPSEHDLEALGQADRYRDVYRHMVRARLENMARVAFKSTLAIVGDPFFSLAFSRYLAERPPMSPLIREVIADFGAFAEQHAVFADAPRFVSDMLAFERAKWEVAYQEAATPKLGVEGLRELDFDGALVLNPVLRLLSLAHPVHRDGREAWEKPAPTWLLVYRPSERDEIRWWSTSALFATIVARVQQGHREPLSRAVRVAVEALSLTLDQALLEKLTDNLTLAVERTVVLGVR